MCRGKNTCSELGTDPASWDKYSPLRTPIWISSAVDTFEKAIENLLSGDKDACLNKLNSINSEKITEWYIEHGQMSGRHRNFILKIPSPTPLPNSQRDLIRSPIRIQNEVFLRDGYKCRYCGTKLISQDFIRLFIKKLNSPIFQRGKTNLTTHGIIHISWPVADHVIPWNLGGRTDASNLVSTCATCNYGKGKFTLEQLGINNPFDRLPILDGWIGLVDKIETLKILNIS